jgi:hypothetical protein
MITYVSEMSSENDNLPDDQFSPPLEAALRRGDSNTSWAPSQGSSQGSSQKTEKKTVDQNKLFLVSLQALVALFT